MKFDGSGDRLRMAVLYFLARVLRGREGTVGISWVYQPFGDTKERFDDDGDEQSTLQIMADTAERFEKAAAEKTNEVVDDDDALEKEGEVGVDVALEEAASVGVDDALEEAASVGVDEMPKRVSKRSHLLRSLFTPN
ncbi:hypothetical protein F2Q69_00042415 [Brassica cretica]|uniref:Uncharacterized protein n=1 Tax=Brassica cretica TaxID=69181 RepID=A0A8S9NJB1_BRACR|nr:hypothetical protein F2Q69_00042415 [Brassica cretica]